MYVEWLRENLKRQKHLGKTRAGLAKVLGLHPSQITRILDGTREIKANELPKMVKYFGVPAPELRVSRERIPAPVVKIRMVAAPSVWRERGTPVMLSTALIGAIPDPKYGSLEQFAVQIEGTKRYAICVDDPSATDFRPGDLVVTEREENGRVETTIRVVTHSPIGRNAEMLPPVPEGQDVIHSLDMLKVVGLVIGFFEAV